ncbi:MAG: hypothetical protein IKZ96_03375 [Bacilli bacterium]|nr:hypothetical protein [Bacilli bacterium]
MDIKEELIDTSDLEIKELEGYYNVFDSADTKIKDGEKEVNSNIEEIKKENEERLLKAEEEAKKIEDTKAEIENLKESYKIALKQIYDSYQDKMDAINKALEIASTNSALKGALEEEKGKMTEELDAKSSAIKTKISELTSFLNKESDEPVINKIDNEDDEESNAEIEAIIKSIQEKIDNLEKENEPKEESIDEDLEAIIRRIDEKINALKSEDEEPKVEDIKFNDIPKTESSPFEIVDKTPVDEDQKKDILLSEEVNNSLESYLG